ncbi:MAG: FadR/GntR family transcriptional regulator, partial [Acidimicrobiia bacterium]
ELNPALAIRGWEGSKRGQATAREIFSRVIEEALPPGSLIGSEAQLMIAHDVSRSGLREAIRILEHHQIAEMRRGQHGGLFVVPADVSAVCEVVAVHLERHGVEQAHLAELRIDVESALVDLVVDRWSLGSEGRLNDTLLAERAVTGDQIVVNDLHAVLAALTGNRVLELVARVLVRLSRLHDGTRTARVRRAMRAEVNNAHALIAEALIEGDRDVARYRLRRHLESVAQATDEGR